MSPIRLPQIRSWRLWHDTISITHEVWVLSFGKKLFSLPPPFPIRIYFESNSTPIPLDSAHNYRFGPCVGPGVELKLGLGGPIRGDNYVGGGFQTPPLEHHFPTFWARIHQFLAISLLSWFFSYESLCRWVSIWDSDVGPLRFCRRYGHHHHLPLHYILVHISSEHKSLHLSPSHRLGMGSSRISTMILPIWIKSWTDMRT